jgi:hypothetical protein
MPHLSRFTRLLIWALRHRPEVLRFTLEVMPLDSEPAPDDDDWINADDNTFLDSLDDDDKHFSHCTDYLEHLFGLPAADDGSRGGMEAPRPEEGTAGA